jgi:hypothetical protein
MVAANQAALQAERLAALGERLSSGALMQERSREIDSHFAVWRTFRTRSCVDRVSLAFVGRWPSQSG